MTSVSDMLSSLPADLMSSAPEFPEPVAEGSGTPDAPPDTTEETPVEAAPADSTPVIEDEPPADAPAGESTETPSDAAPATDAATEDVEEGTLREKDAKTGKYKYRLDEPRYKTIYSHHQLVQQATDAIGEPITVEGIKHLHDVSLAHDRMWDHLTSGDPAQQANVLNEIIQQMGAAHTDGETGVDPSIPFAQTVYETLRDNAPEAYNTLRFQAARDSVNDMFEMAASTNDPLLFGSAQRFAAAIAGIGPKPADVTDAQYAQQIREATTRASIPFYTMNEMAGLNRGEDPVAALQRRNQQLEAQLNTRTGTTASERFNQWNTSHVQAVNTAVFNDAVKPALASAETAWKDFPEDYQRLIVDPLNREVTKAVRDDQVLDQQIKDLNARARRATSDGVRQQIGEQIKQLFVNRAKLAADKAKGPILKFAAEALQGRSQQNNGRRAAAQTRTAPQGQSSPVRPSAMPAVQGFKNGVFDSTTAYKQALAALPR